MNELRVHVKCSFCRQSLMDKEHPIDGQPSIEAIIQYGNKRGLVRLSSLYGSFAIESEISVPFDEIVLFFCPHCNSSFLTNRFCERCHAPMAFFELLNGGKVEICSRRGCQEHFLEFSSLAQKTSALYNSHEVFANPLRRRE